MRFASSLLLFAACTKPPTTPMAPGAGGATAAPTNTSIAAARPLRAGDVMDFLLPCGGEKLYFGPVAFAAENDRVALTTTVRSTNGEQVCGGGSWIDGAGVFVTTAGLGCIDLHHDYTQRTENTFTPGAGGSTATPQYLELHKEQVAGPGCGTVSVHMVVEAAPGGGAVKPPIANPTLDAAADAAARARIYEMVLGDPRDGKARAALMSLSQASAINDTTFGALGVKRDDLQRAVDELGPALGGDAKDRRAALDAFAARWGGKLDKLRAAGNLSTATPSGGEVSIRDCVRDGKGGAPASKVEIRDCVRDKNMLYRALSLSGGDATVARPQPNGVFALSKLLATPGSLPAESASAPPFETAGSRDDAHGYYTEPGPYADVRGQLRLPNVTAGYAENKHAEAFVSTSITTGDRPKTVLAEIRYTSSGYAVGLGYATTGFAADLVVANGSNQIVCRDHRQDGVYGPGFAVALVSVSAPRFVACTVPAHTTGTIVVGLTAWAAAGGFAYAGMSAMDGTIGLRIVDAVPLNEL